MKVRAAGVVLLAAGTLLALTGRAPADEPAKEAAPAEAPAYAGSDICEADQAESYGKTPHAAALAASTRPASGRGCEACHGPGQAHFDAGGGKGVGGIRSFA